MDPTWPDLTQMVQQAQQNKLSVVLHPVLRYNGDPQVWWQGAARNDGWWQTWFARYRTFLLYHADLATQSGAKALIIGDETILPALPGGTFADGTTANTPADAEERWINLIAAVRARYSGQMVWMIPYAGGMPAAPDFLSAVDLIYLQLSPPLLENDQPSMEEVQNAIAATLDEDILALQEKTNHPILLGLQYPSALGAYDGCPGSGETCLPLENFRQPGFEAPGVEMGLEDQAFVYNAALAAVEQRSWISGFIASGYYPPAELKDLSISMRGKPAADVLWYWYPRLLGQETP
jgi:hypothetical protein